MRRTASPSAPATPGPAYRHNRADDADDARTGSTGRTGDTAHTARTGMDRPIIPALGMAVRTGACALAAMLLVCIPAIAPESDIMPPITPASAYAAGNGSNDAAGAMDGASGGAGQSNGSGSSNGGQCQAGVENYVTQTPWTNTLFDFPSLHQRSTGAGVTVAVIDSGVDTDNPHLEGAVVPGMSLVPGDPSAGMADTYSHGTAVAGIIAARPAEGSQVQGMAPGATILPIRVFESIREENGRQTGAPSMEDVASAVTYAVDHGAKVINVSLSDTRDIPEMRQAVSYAESHGSLIVASAGNRLTSASTKDGERYPAAYPEVIGVTALNTSLAPTNDSVHGDQVDVAAPGMRAAGTIPGGVDCVFATDAASSSFATAYVSGEAALIAASHPDETPAQWRQRILATANRTNPDERDDQTGWGVMDPLNALTVTLSPNLRGPGQDAANAGRFTRSSIHAPITLRPVVDPNAGVKRIVGIGAIGMASLWAVAWIAGLGRRRRGSHGSTGDSSSAASIESAAPAAQSGDDAAQSGDDAA